MVKGDLFNDFSSKGGLLRSELLLIFRSLHFLSSSDAVKPAEPEIATLSPWQRLVSISVWFQLSEMKTNLKTTGVEESFQTIRLSAPKWPDPWPFAANNKIQCFYFKTVALIILHLEIIDSSLTGVVINFMDWNRKLFLIKRYFGPEKGRLVWNSKN